MTVAEVQRLCVRIKNNTMMKVTTVLYFCKISETLIL